MNSETKKCPMCAEEIPLASIACQYCDAQFEVTSSGYCQTCHEVRDADENGQCRVCGSAVVDLRVESKFIEESAQEPLPIAQHVTQPEKSRAGKGWLPIGILAGILILAVIVASLWVGRNSAPAISSPVATNTPRATITSAPTLAPTATSTNTPRPTPTVTPLPAWVSDFAEPILLEIANRSPTIQDDMHDNSGGWVLESWCGNSTVKSFVNSEFMLDNCVATRSKMAFTDFVLELDARFIQGTDPLSVWSIYFRDTSTGPSYSVGVDYAGTFWMLSNSIESDDRIQSGTGTNHILIIAKGPRFAFYMNDQPIAYLEDSTLWQRGSISLKTWLHGRSYNFNDHSITAFDNLKIWDISDLP